MSISIDQEAQREARLREREALRWEGTRLFIAYLAARDAHKKAPNATPFYDTMMTHKRAYIFWIHELIDRAVPIGDDE